MTEVTATNLGAATQPHPGKFYTETGPTTGYGKQRQTVLSGSQ